MSLKIIKYKIKHKIYQKINQKRNKNIIFVFDSKKRSDYFIKNLQNIPPFMNLTFNNQIFISPCIKTIKYLPDNSCEITISYIDQKINKKGVNIKS